MSSTVAEKLVPTLALRNIVRSYGDDLVILDDANFGIMPGEIVALLGPSGSGKSTLLHLAGLLERPNSGEVYINGQPTTKMSDKRLTNLRREEVGFVYQFHHLLPEFTALMNVAIPIMLSGATKIDAEMQARELLTDMGLEHRLDHQPAQLSGGEKQRVAIARALANQPSLLLADEPTGNLDISTSGKVFDELLKLVREQGLAALIATHDRTLAAKMDRIVAIHERKLVRVRLQTKAAV